MEKVSNKNPFVRFKPREIQIAQHQMNSKKVYMHQRTCENG